MDKTFLESFNNHPRLQLAVKYASEQKDWFSYQELVELLNQDAIKRHPEKNKGYKGYPHSTRTSILYLIKIGFLLADPLKGLMMNKDFVPKI